MESGPCLERLFALLQGQRGRIVRRCHHPGEHRGVQWDGDSQRINSRQQHLPKAIEGEVSGLGPGAEDIWRIFPALAFWSVGVPTRLNELTPRSVRNVLSRGPFTIQRPL